MSSSAAFAYMQARLQARLGETLDTAGWAALASAVHLTTFLERARETRLRPWVAGFSASSSVHEIESGLRGQLRRLIDEVAGWLPGDWAAATRWVKILVDLPAWTYLMRGEPVLAWMRDDPVLGDLAIDDPIGRRQALMQGEAGLLVRAWEAGEPLHLTWLREWRRRWPPTTQGEAARLNQLVALLDAQLKALMTWEQRRALRARLVHALHQGLLQPAAAFAYLAIVALDLERLRAELVSRALFSCREGGA
jgi:hypothetical protein